MIPANNLNCGAIHFDDGFSVYLIRETFISIFSCIFWCSTSSTYLFVSIFLSMIQQLSSRCPTLAREMLLKQQKYLHWKFLPSNCFTLKLKLSKLQITKQDGNLFSYHFKVLGPVNFNLFIIETIMNLFFRLWPHWNSCRSKSLLVDHVIKNNYVFQVDEMCCSDNRLPCW